MYELPSKHPTRKAHHLTLKICRLLLAGGGLKRLGCGAEDIDIVRRTIMAAYDAPLPVGCQRTIYVCDDGKDPKKRKFCDKMGPEVLPLSNSPSLTCSRKKKNGNTC